MGSGQRGEEKACECREADNGVHSDRRLLDVWRRRLRCMEGGGAQRAMRGGDERQRRGTLRWNGERPG